MTKNKVIILRYNDLIPIFEYIDSKYGKDFLNKI